MIQKNTIRTYIYRAAFFGVIVFGSSTLSACNCNYKTDPASVEAQKKPVVTDDMTLAQRLAVQRGEDPSKVETVTNGYQLDPDVPEPKRSLTKADFAKYKDDPEKLMDQVMGSESTGIGLVDEFNQDNVTMPDIGDYDTKEITDQELRQYAGAYSRIEPLKEQYNKRMRHVESAEEFYEIKKEADAAAERAAKMEGMEFDDYMSLTKRMAKDAPLRDRLDVMVERLKQQQNR